MAVIDTSAFVKGDCIGFRLREIYQPKFLSHWGVTALQNQYIFVCNAHTKSVVYFPRRIGKHILEGTREAVVGYYSSVAMGHMLFDENEYRNMNNFFVPQYTGEPRLSGLVDIMHQRLQPTGATLTALLYISRLFSDIIYDIDTSFPDRVGFKIKTTKGEIYLHNLDLKHGSTSCIVKFDAKYIGKVIESRKLHPEACVRNIRNVEKRVGIINTRIRDMISEKTRPITVLGKMPKK